MAAPASAAAIADSAIAWGDTGRYGDMDGVWMAPVIAQEITTARVFLAFVIVTVAPGLSPMPRQQLLVETSA